MAEKTRYTTIPDQDDGPIERRTSIRAEIHRMVAITMSTIEIDTICEMLGKVHDAEMTSAERTIRSEFLSQVESVR